MKRATLNRQDIVRLMTEEKIEQLEDRLMDLKDDHKIATEELAAATREAVRAGQRFNQAKERAAIKAKAITEEAWALLNAATKPLDGKARWLLAARVCRRTELRMGMLYDRHKPTINLPIYPRKHHRHVVALLMVLADSVVRNPVGVNSKLAAMGTTKILSLRFVRATKKSVLFVKSTTQENTNQ